MKEYTMYQPALLDLFLDSMGAGFSSVIEKYNPTLKANKLKQKRMEMRTGKYWSYREIVEAVLEVLRVIKEGFNTSGFNDMFYEKKIDIKLQINKLSETPKSKYILL